MPKFVYPAFPNDETALFLVENCGNNALPIPSAGFITPEVAYENSPEGYKLVCVEIDDDAILDDKFTCNEIWKSYSQDNVISVSLHKEN